MKEEVVLSEQQLSCLSSPVRVEVFESLNSQGQASARELSELTGMSTQTIHFHLNELLAVNLVEILERRPAKKRPESIFRPTARSYCLPEIKGKPDLEKAVSKSISATLRRVLRGFGAHAHDPNNAQILRTVVCLSEADRVEFEGMIQAALTFAKERRDAAAVPRAITMLMHPKS